MFHFCVLTLPLIKWRKCEQLVKSIPYTLVGLKKNNFYILKEVYFESVVDTKTCRFYLKLITLMKLHFEEILVVILWVIHGIKFWGDSSDFWVIYHRCNLKYMSFQLATRFFLSFHFPFSDKRIQIPLETGDFHVSKCCACNIFI